MTIPFVWLFIFLQFCCTEDVDTSSHAEICQQCHVTTLMASLSNGDIPHPKQLREGERARVREGSVGCTAPMRTHSCSHWLFLLVMMSAQIGRGQWQGQALPVVVAQLCTGQWFGPSVGFAWQGQDPDNQCKVREGSHSTTQQHPDVLSELCSSLHCRINGPEFKELTVTKYSNSQIGNCF